MHQACKRISWELLIIARNVLARELVLPFVRNQLSQCDNGDLWVCQCVTTCVYTIYIIKYPNYLLVCEIVFEILDATFMYREGESEGYKAMVQSAPSKLPGYWDGGLVTLRYETCNCLAMCAADMFHMCLIYIFRNYILPVIICL